MYFEKKIWVLCLWISVPLSLCALNPVDVIKQWKEFPYAAYQIDYFLTQPQSDQEVRYRIALFYQAVPNDSVAGYDYLCDIYHAQTSENRPDFTAYLSGAFYSYRNHQLTEYHIEESPELFKEKQAGNRKKQGVHRSWLFSSELLPEMALWLDELRTDSSLDTSCYPDTLIDGIRSLLFEAERFAGNELIQKIRLCVDAQSGMPREKEVIYNRGTLGEHTLKVIYTPMNLPQEEIQKHLQPDLFLEEKAYAFTLNRNSDFALTHLQGKPAPRFELPQLNKDLPYAMEEESEKMQFLLFVDPRQSASDSLLVAFRPFYQRDPQDIGAEFLLVFIEKEPEQIAPYVSQFSFPGRVLYDGSAAVRSYGIPAYPSIVVLDAQRRVLTTGVGYDPTFIRHLVDLLQTP